MMVYVLMGNDFPSAVFADEAEAERVAKANNEEPENQHWHGTGERRRSYGRRVYWRVYPFELRGHAA